ncbi:MAG: lysylphosphatidylglycerol synthase transmembrane domain-containing protein [Gemmataceae bacterium]
MSKLLRLGVSALLLGWIALKMDWAAVGHAFAHLDIWPWLLGVAILVAAQCVSAWRWYYFARELRFERPIWQLSSFYFIGMYFGLMLPTTVGGDVVRAWYLDAGSGRKLAAFGAVFLDRLNGVLVLISIACVATLLSPTTLPPWVVWSVFGIAACAFGGLAMLPFLGAWRGPGAASIQKLRQTVGLLRSPRILPITTLLSFCVQTSSIAIVWLIGEAVGVEVPGSFYWVLVPLMSLLMLLPAVNGWGVRETGMIALLGPMGVSDGVALSMAFLWFLNGAAVSLLGGLVYLFGHFPKPEAPAQAPDEDEHGPDHPGPVDRHPDQGRTRQLDQAA